MGITRLWADRPGVQRFDLYTRAPLYLVSASEPVVLMLLIGSQPQVRSWAAGALLLVGCVHTVVCLRLLHLALDSRLDGTRLGAPLVGVAVGLTVVGLAVGPVAFPDYTSFLGSDGFPVGLAVVIVFCGAVTAAATPALPGRALLAVIATPALVLAGLQAVAATAMNQPPWAFNYLLVVGVLAVVYRSSGWVLGVVWEIDRARNVQARLAVAEERLRVARDVHDLLGRNLTLIAINSDLAAQLAHRNTDAAVAAMLQVRQTAQESMRDVREVVTGHHGVDLDSELAGARSVLRSAGITTRVIGDGTGLPAGVQAGLGWAVREATTNILRHADPTTVTIELSTVTDQPGRPAARLRIDNDGIRAPEPDSPADGHGHGLTGLRQRLARLGGDLTTTTTPNGRFVVDAYLPLTPPDVDSNSLTHGSGPVA